MVTRPGYHSLDRRMTPLVNGELSVERTEGSFPCGAALIEALLTAMDAAIAQPYI